jgi:hypothetical protein
LLGEAALQVLELVLVLVLVLVQMQGQGQGQVQVQVQVLLRGEQARLRCHRQVGEY